MGIEYSGFCLKEELDRAASAGGSRPGSTVTASDEGFARQEDRLSPIASRPDLPVLEHSDFDDGSEISFGELLAGAPFLLLGIAVETTDSLIRRMRRYLLG